MICRGDCVKDEMTGEIFCPAKHGWVDKCPKHEEEEVRDGE